MAICEEGNYYPPGCLSVARLVGIILSCIAAVLLTISLVLYLTRRKKTMGTATVVEIPMNNVGYQQAYAPPPGQPPYFQPGYNQGYVPPYNQSYDPGYSTQNYYPAPPAPPPNSSNPFENNQGLTPPSGPPPTYKN
ncbi:uncharacterized protein ASCRUDRAFT_79064 [Ascoidea rubescens DSM 1968]|uniref:Uncharacterized protein n=1 Tax=Ascoidea rubescens DSM 1968 TaxID=1344418 RepID=A0A1D2VRB9_9ASCO|nr:hypothetical protein ASCRUDRAFT_79064 [Ascoidea rubescens DSM 1968]ODV64151.1 hypothetical protein ASCRUDRAFT_79064 [Ascoidea rubescens DSM 1968]